MKVVKEQVVPNDLDGSSRELKRNGPSAARSVCERPKSDQLFAYSMFVDSS